LSRRPLAKKQSRRSPARESSAPATKYYRSGSISDKSSPFESKKIKQKKYRLGRKLVFGFMDILVVVALLFGLVYSLIVRPDPQISASSLVYRPPSAYRQAVIKQFQILKNRNKITLDDQAIVKSLQAQFPEIASASVELPLLGEIPIVHLSIATPSFFLSSGGNLYVVDAQGYIADKTINLAGIKNLPTLSDQSGFKVTVGQQAMNTANVSFINTVVAEAKRAKVPISSLTLPALAQELDLRTSDRGYYVKFFLGGDVLQQAGQFLAARHSFDQSGNNPSGYLDVRVPGKIYYK
jgi:cell division septal protein FtsQ